jgi:hypothetical protein
MITFDTYFCDPEPTCFDRQPALTTANATLGEVRWLDGIDALGDQYFDHRKVGEEVLFIMIPATIAMALPQDVSVIESLLVVRARIVELSSSTIAAKGLLEDVQPLGEWARRVKLDPASDLNSVPEQVRPDAAMIERVRKQTLWVAPDEPWKQGMPVFAAVYVCRGDDGRERCVMLGRSFGRSYLTHVTAK